MEERKGRRKRGPVMPLPYLEISEHQSHAVGTEKCRVVSE
jgi:hypothetical protein